MMLAPPPGTTRTDPPLRAEAHSIFQTSFAKFEKTVQKYSKEDARDFNSTALRDVYEAAKEVERQLRARQCIRNMSRIEPLLKGLENYSKVIEVLCNGTDYLPWIWAPIKLMLKLASDYISAFERLIAAYGQIAECLPRFDRLCNAIDNPDFQRVLAVIYSDIMEFHRRAYKFFRKSGWKCFFNSSWARFDGQFNCILDSLRRHTDLVDREANAFLIAESFQWRKEAREAAAQKETERCSTQLAAVLAWLSLENDPHCGQSDQDGILDQLLSDCYPGTTEWIVTHPQMRSWLKKDREQALLWLKGKPGAGKSTLCAKLVQFLKTDNLSTVMCCFFSYRIHSRHPHPSGFILAMLLSQLLRQNLGLSVYVYTEFVTKMLSPSIQNLKEILKNLLPQVKGPVIVVDGFDECIKYDLKGNPTDLNVAKVVLRDIMQLNSIVTSTPIKVLLVSRDVPQFTGILSKKPCLCLDEDNTSVRKAIRAFVKYRLSEIRDNFLHLDTIDKLLENLEHRIVEKSQGMFLWVQLVLLQLEDDAYNMSDLENAIATMPVGLNDIYARIIERLKALGSQSNKRAIKILQWMVCARRPLRVAELQNALVFDEDNFVLTDENKLPETVVNICKPLIQRQSDSTVTFVHFTVQEYLIKSGFISSLHAECVVATTCISYLVFSQSLIDTSIPDEVRTVNVSKSLHSLQDYAYHYWVDHILDFAERSTGFQAASVLRCLDRLLDQVRTFRAHSDKPSTELMTEQTDALGPYDHRLVHLASQPAVRELLSRVLHFRALARQLFGDSTSVNDVDDYTPFSYVYADYNRRVHLLLTSQSFPGISAAQLDAFKRNHGSSAFLCRFPGCTNPSIGFPTDELRMEHERTHAPRFLCTYPQCPYALGFRSLPGLKRHIRENHDMVSSRIPRNVRTSATHRVDRSMEERHTTPTSSEKIRFGVPQALKPVTAPPRKSNLMALMNDPEPQLEQETGNVHIMPASGNLEIDTGDQSNHIAEIGKRLEAAMEELNTLEHLDQLEELVNEGLSVGGRFPEMLALYSRSKDLKWLKKARELQDNPLELQDVTEIIQEGLKLHIHPDQSDLRYFQEQEVRGERWEAEAKEVLAVEPLDYPKLDLLLKQSAFIPVTPNTLSAVRTPLTKYQETGDLMVSLYKRSKNFDFHQRPKYKEMWDVMEAVSDINDKPFGFIDLEREQKRHEDWMRRGKKMFGMANAPLHALHLRMNQVEHRNQSCFDISDQPRMPVEPASREASPVEGESVDGSGSSRDVFCICRRPEADVMIECELCQEWYHGKCLKIDCGKVKRDDIYTCPICDYRVKIPRDTTRPNLDDLITWQDEILNLPFQPEEEDTLESLIKHGSRFREYIARFINPLTSSPDDLNIQRFYLRKLEGAEILLAQEINFFRQELHKWAPVAPTPPPQIQVSLSTHKPRPTKYQKLMNQLGISDPENLL